MYETFKEEVKKQGYSINSVALKSEVTPTNLYNALKGNVKFYDSWKTRLANTLKITEDKLFPDAEAETARRGKWVMFDKKWLVPSYLYKCSECAGESDSKTNYCPNCGAKMDKE